MKLFSQSCSLDILQFQFIEKVSTKLVMLNTYVALLLFLLTFPYLRKHVTFVDSFPYLRKHVTLVDSMYLGNG